MISYDLLCPDDHRFEGWFGSSSDYDVQLADGLIQCPICGSGQISKALTAPNVAAKGNQKSTEPELHAPDSADALPRAAEGEAASVSNMPEMPAEMVKAVEQLAEMQKKVLKDSEWVGRKFADEARAIHYGETEDRIIHGEASPEEAEELAEEGVPVAPLLFPYIPSEAKN